MSGDKPYVIRQWELLYNGFANLSAYHIDLTTRDGRRLQMRREVHDHGSGVAGLLHDPQRDTVLLIRQFRMAVAVESDETDGLLIEAPAGLLDGADPAERMRAELEEETGYRAEELEFVAELYSSPGMLTERMFLFVGSYSHADKVSDGGGLEHEGEDIEVLEIPFREALAMCRDGRIRDAKTMILLQHLALKQAGLG